jgi:hypothetical protein
VPRCGTGRDLTIQHRVNRAMGGSRAPGINTYPNLPTACQLYNMRFEDRLGGVRQRVEGP